MTFDEDTLNKASQQAFACDFKYLDESNKRWIIEGLQRLKKEEHTDI